MSEKLKRQLRDWYNKNVNVNDTATLLKVAVVINYPYINKEATNVQIDERHPAVHSVWQHSNNRSVQENGSEA